MVNEPAYAPPLADTVRTNIRVAVDALNAATGLTDTLVSRVIKQDGAFIARMLSNPMTVRTYDEAMGRLSAVWPSDVEWPAAVPRPAPVEVDTDLRAMFDAALLKSRAIKAREAAREAKRLAREDEREAKRIAREARAAALNVGRGKVAAGDPAPSHV